MGGVRERAVTITAVFRPRRHRKPSTWARGLLPTGLGTVSGESPPGVAFRRTRREGRRITSLQDTRNDMRAMGVGGVPRAEIVRRFGQQIEYRSSFPGCIGSGTRFGVMVSVWTVASRSFFGCLRP